MKFLQQIAEYYIGKKADLSRYTFVFPNKRSAMFMRKYLKERFPATGFMPRMVSITYFVDQFCDTTLAAPDELIFILYRVYCDTLRAHGRESQIKDFDTFIFWGNIMLNDFNDVDAYMVDPDQLFRNLKGEREIQANYLTESQIEVANQIWGAYTSHSDVEGFWRHMPSDPAKEGATDKFLNLWEVLGEIYQRFRKALEQHNPPLAYSGLQSRKACEKIRSLSADELDGTKYVFVGFNVLSASRALIFKHLKRMGVADFFWDTASPYICESNLKCKADINKAALFIMPLVRQFPMPDDFELQPIETEPEIEVIAVPSNSGQTKAAAMVLNKWRDDGELDQHSLISTALVLPDQQLLIPTLYAIDPQISPINVTMGVPYSTTPFASLLTSIISMQLRMRQSRQDFYFFYKDVFEVLSHPHIDLIAHDDASRLKAKLAHEKAYNISAKEIVDNFPSLAFIFEPVVDPKDIDAVRGYAVRLIDTLTARLRQQMPDGSKNYYELKILEAYRRAIDTLCGYIDRYEVRMEEHTFYSLLERALTNSVINFNGSPIEGLQIMGVMDTRALDFDNVIILSMNERIFPKKNFTPSLIPAALRLGYEMPTQEHEESTYAYQFYRLISRAKRVRLIYDSRTGGLSSGEMSRYIFQLVHLSGSSNIKVKSAELPPRTNPERVLVIDKTPEVVAELRRFRPGGDLNLSASALKAYIKCPLMFYLQYVKRLRTSEEAVDYMDAVTYGNVIHHLAEKLYLEHKGQLINDVTISSMLAKDLTTMALCQIDADYYKGRYSANLSMMPGEGQILAKIIVRYFTAILNWEKSQPDFVFVDAEFGGKALTWRVNDKYTLNFTMSIDRIDRLDANTLRFIDYKSGGDKTEATNIEAIFTNKDLGGIFQLLTYCHAYSAIYGFDGDIKPVIYKIVSIVSDGVTDIRIGGAKNGVSLNSHKDLKDEFSSRLEELIDNIFEEDNNVPFKQTEKIDNCHYCPFASMCGRFVKDNSSVY